MEHLNSFIVGIAAFAAWIAWRAVEETDQRQDGVEKKMRSVDARLHQFDAAFDRVLDRLQSIEDDREKQRTRDTDAQAAIADAKSWMSAMSSRISTVEDECEDHGELLSSVGEKIEGLTQCDESRELATARLEERLSAHEAYASKEIDALRSKMRDVEAAAARLKDADAERQRAIETLSRSVGLCHSMISEVQATATAATAAAARHDVQIMNASATAQEAMRVAAAVDAWSDMVDDDLDEVMRACGMSLRDRVNTDNDDDDDSEDDSGVRPIDGGDDDAS